MKIFAAYLCFFALPDNFSGGLSDALRAMADYHEGVTGGDDSRSGKGLDMSDIIDRPLGEVYSEMFDRFSAAVKDGKRACGIMQIKKANI